MLLQGPVPTTRKTRSLWAPKRVSQVSPQSPAAVAHPTRARRLAAWDVQVQQQPTPRPRVQLCARQVAVRSETQSPSADTQSWPPTPGVAMPRYRCCPRGASSHQLSFRQLPAGPPPSGQRAHQPSHSNNSQGNPKRFLTWVGCRAPGRGSKSPD